MTTAATIERRTSSALSSRKPGSGDPVSALASKPSSFGRLLLILCICGLAYAAVLVTERKLYTSRSAFGFYLGVTGTLMMLALLAYPLRKHLSFMQRWGALKHWFRVHMILGLLGPTLILFHSTFHIRSQNAAVALGSMLIVVASGVIGRFVYSQIHYGLYGRRATAEKLQEVFLVQSDNAVSRLHTAPHIEQWLQRHHVQAMRSDRSLASACWHLLVLKMQRPFLAWRCARELRRLQRHESQPDLRRTLAEASDWVSVYLKELERVAHFTTYERLFALWHVLHIPLIYLLAASTVFHIIAVYMY